MPSFVCDVCQETLKKAKLDSHKQRCRNASFSCIDCYKSFKGDTYRAHTSCITEVEKYHGKKINKNNHQTDQTSSSKSKAEPEPKKPRADDPLLNKVVDLLACPVSLKELRKKLKEKNLSKSFDERCIVSAQNGNVSITFNNIINNHNHTSHN